MEPLIIGNWKLNPKKTLEAINTFKAIKKALQKDSKTVVCVPTLYIPELSKLMSNHISIGAQDAFETELGAHTGKVSALLLKQYKVSHCLIGHSEMRASGDTDEIVSQKLRSVLKQGIIPVLCVGEKERTEEHWYLHVVKEQILKAFDGLSPNEIKKVVIAYEPIWAIGKDAIRSSTPSECEEMTIFIRRVIADMVGEKIAHTIKVIYGGSVDKTNAQSFMDIQGVTGLLIGRASLSPKDFTGIINNAYDTLKEKNKQYANTQKNQRKTKAQK